MSSQPRTLVEYQEYPEGEDPGEFRVHMLHHDGLTEAYGLLLPVVFTFADWCEFCRRAGIPETEDWQMSVLTSFHKLPRVEIVPDP